MNMFRDRLISKQIEASGKWNYPMRVQRRPARKQIGGDGNDGSQASLHDESQDGLSRIGDNAG